MMASLGAQDLCEDTKNKHKMKHHFLVISILVSGAVPYCLFPHELNLIELDASCSGTPSLQLLPCEQALDYNTDTVWHPRNDQERYFTLRLGQKVVISHIRIMQFRWVHGSAKKLR